MLSYICYGSIPNKQREVIIMSLNQQCPKCGSTHVQLSNIENKHGCFWFIIFGLPYLFWVMIKWCIGCMVFMFFDWWMAIVKKSQGKGYVWKSKRWFSGRKKTYYCHDCSHNFKG